MSPTVVRTRRRELKYRKWLRTRINLNSPESFWWHERFTENPNVQNEANWLMFDALAFHGNVHPDFAAAHDPDPIDIRNWPGLDRYYPDPH